jgi:nucleoid-associated protein EbfC
MMNQARLMAQVKKMQEEMAKAQEELANTVVQGSAGGGVVTVDVTCDQHVKSVTISPEAVDPDDVETLEDLVTAAINDALARAQEMSAKRMQSVTGGVRIPGMT